MADGGEDPSRGMKREREREQDDEMEAAARAVRARNQALIGAPAGNQGLGGIPPGNHAMAVARAMVANQNSFALQQQQRQQQLRTPLLGGSALQLNQLSAPLGGLPPMAGVPNLLGAVGGVQDPAMRNLLLSQMLSGRNQAMHVNPVSTQATGHANPLLRSQAAGLPMAAMGHSQHPTQNHALLLSQHQALQHQQASHSLLNSPTAAVDASKSGATQGAVASVASLPGNTLGQPQAKRNPASKSDEGEPDEDADPGFRPRRDSESGERSLILYVPSDDESLSPFQCLARKHIELFEAQQEDVEAGAQGRNKPIVLGQVGIRCVHCKMLPPNMRARAAVYYPSKLSVLYQACQNIVNLHLPQLCDGVPDDVRSELLSLGKKKSAVGGGKNYWSDAAEILGVRNTDGQGLRFQDSAVDE